MKYFELTSKEKRILEDFDKGNLVSIAGAASKKKIYQKFAKNSLAKNKNINIRLSEKVLARLKTKAAEQGIPYQTLASSVLHRYVSS